MKKTIEFEFDEEWLDNVATENLRALLYKSIFDVAVYANVKKVTVDGADFWSKDRDTDG